MSSICCYCETSAENGSMDSKIRCMGPCKAYVHLTCVKLTKTALKYFGDCPEMHFYCKVCNQYSMVGIRDSLDNFSQHINNLNEALKPLAAIDFNTMVQQFNINKSTEQTSTTNKRRLLNDGTVQLNNDIQNSVQTFGTKESDALNTVSVQQRKSLVISRLATTTTEQIIEKYINDNLDSAVDIRCSKLLPSGRNLEDLNYISFRISAPDNVFNKMYNSDFWPRGVQLREYVYKSRNNKTNKPIIPVSFLTSQ